MPLALCASLAACDQHRSSDACGEVGAAGNVELEPGLVRGHESGSVCAFAGVPYAAPPLGERRFRPPDSVPSWSGMRVAQNFGPWCPQLTGGGDVIGDEDCLYFNVWTSSSKEPLRPVFVFLHGGGNVAGSSSEPVYDGTHLAEQSGAVVFSLDYRLGPLGYLAHDSFGLSSEVGNYGLEDQKMALEFIRRHAPLFGGDPDRLLVFGQSAGSRNLCALIADSSKTLFRGAALESGACELVPQSEAYAFGDQFVAATSCAGASDVATCLRALPMNDVLTALPDPPTPLTTSHYDPNDGWTGAILPAALPFIPFQQSLSVIVGANAEEIGGVAQPLDTAAHYETLVRVSFGNNADRILELYPASDYASPRDAWIAVVTDARYICPSQQTAEGLSASGFHKVYRYLFAHGLDHGAMSEWGAFHALELLFLFRNFDVLAYEPTDDEWELSDRMIGYYTRLADRGDPNGGDAVNWPTYDKLSSRYLKLDTPTEAGDNLHADRCNFWIYEYVR